MGILISLFFAALLSTENYLVQMPTSLVLEVKNAQIRTSDTRREEYFCLIGKVRKSDSLTTMTIRNLVKPEQTTYLGFKWLRQTDQGPTFVSQVMAKSDCPEGTIGDLHTHPWKGEPSDPDKATWVIQDKYFLHMVSSKTSGDKYQIRSFVVVPEKGGLFSFRNKNVNIYSIRPYYDIP